MHHVGHVAQASPNNRAAQKALAEKEDPPLQAAKTKGAVITWITWMSLAKRGAAQKALAEKEDPPLKDCKDLRSMIRWTHVGHLACVGHMNHLYDMDPDRHRSALCGKGGSPGEDSKLLGGA